MLQGEFLPNFRPSREYAPPPVRVSAANITKYRAANSIPPPNSAPDSHKYIKAAAIFKHNTALAAFVKAPKIIRTGHKTSAITHSRSDVVEPMPIGFKKFWELPESSIPSLGIPCDSIKIETVVLRMKIPMSAGLFICIFLLSENFIQKKFKNSLTNFMPGKICVIN